ncbi:MAG: tail tape measure protein [Erythrobacter sp.]
MDDNLDTLVIDVRANTQGFAADLEGMKSSVDSSLLDGFSKAGNTLERGLVSALRKGSLGFDDLKKVALRSLDEIASKALQSGIGNLFGGSGGHGGSGGLGGLIGQSLGGLLGLPGRATGGPVAPGRGYIVGERGPELFVPTSAGRVETGATSNAAGRDVRVAINLASPRGTTAPTAMQRSSRQVASAVRQALANS